MYWESTAEVAIRAAVKRVKDQESEARRAKFARAVDFMEGNLRGHIESELFNRFPSSQKGDSGQRIHPVCVSLVERYVQEQANAYNKPVRRYFVDESGAETDATKEQTKKLQDMLDACAYDSIMHRAEQVMSLLGSSCVWYQSKRGQLHPVIVMPHDVYPVAPDEAHFMNAADPDDYAGFIVELYWATDSIIGSSKRTFAYVTKTETTFFTGAGPDSIDQILSTHPNPFEWDQWSEAGAKRMPGSMLSFLHDRIPLGGLIPDHDVDIVDAATEICVALSALFDNIRFQGHAVPVKKLNNPADAKAIQRHGVRFPAVLDISESFELASAGTNYTEQVQVLKDFVRLVSITKRMSPNDMALDGVSPASGFAKLVDSLPKIDARSERIRRLVPAEERNGERLKAIGITLGLLDEVCRGMKLRARFPDVEFPRSEIEKDQIAAREILYNFTTPAQMLAKADGISEVEAQARIDANKQVNGMPAKAEQPTDFMSGFGSKIGKRGSV